MQRVASFPLAAALLTGAFFLHAGCGGSTSGVHPPQGDDVGDDLGDDVGCITPKQGDACAQGENACPEYFDACAEPYSWVCTQAYGWDLVAPAACIGGDEGVGDGGCIEPTEGAACNPQQVACQPANACCAGYVWSCNGTPPTWQKEGLGCACEIEAGGPFACGTTTCTASQFCEVQPPGIANVDGGPLPDGYTCAPVPPQCASSPTCACIESTIAPSDTCSTHTPGVSCSESAGQVTIDCIGE